MNDFLKYANQANSSAILSKSLGEIGTFQQDTLLHSSVRDTVLQKSDTVPTKPSYEEIRYWHWQREKKLLINDSRYMISKSGDQLVLVEEIEPPTLVLPNRVKHQFNTDWLTLVLLFALVLLASVRAGYVKYIGSLFQSVFNYPTSFRLFGEKNNSVLQGAVRLELLYYLVFSVFVFQLLNFSPLDSAKFSLLFFGKTIGVLFVYFLLKKFVYKLLGTIFQGVPETSEFLFNLNNFNRVTGIVLFPVVALIAYYPFDNPMFIAVLGILATLLLYLLLLVRGISILLKKQFSIFYLFLYLCSLEFLPLLLIYKVVVG